jgi:hypothetical protein
VKILRFRLRFCYCCRSASDLGVVGAADDDDDEETALASVDWSSLLG